MTTKFHNHSLSSDQFSGAVSIPAQTFTSTGYMELFGVHNAADDGHAENFSGNLYSLKFWSDPNTLSYDFVPCYRKSDSVAGVYDTINKVFYTNNGSGTFAVGADV